MPQLTIRSVLAGMLLGGAIIGILIILLEAAG